ncbi:MAG: NHL repeat-containing protein [Candidatus Hydrogenedentes bacterium]|nr:NHL repeat-containing protein [Candidatus Hydrogenedentota bacterium]
MRNPTRARYSAIVYILGILIACSAWGQTLPQNRRATIAPSLVNLKPGGEQKFKVVLIATRLMAAGAPQTVKWAVNDVPGGNAELGAITPEGIYRAPAAAPSPREVHICAEVPESANPYLLATVILGEGEPVYKPCGYWSEPVIEGKDKTERLIDPHGIGLDIDGNILIADQKGNQVLRYSVKGEFLGKIGSGSGSEPGQFTEPRIVTSDKDGRIFVSDSKGDRPRIQVFNNKGEFLQIFGEKGMRPGMLLRCHGLSIDPQGRLFTTDVDNMRVNVYDKKGEFLYDWGKEGLNPGEMNAPHGIFVDKNSDVFVTGYYGPTQKFNSRGDFVCAFCFGDPPDGPVYFHNMMGDRWGNVYTSVRSKGGYQGAIAKDGKHRSFEKYNNNGTYVTSFSFTDPEHSETTATVDAQGRVYALFKGKKEMGVEIFQEE